MKIVILSGAPGPKGLPVRSSDMFRSTHHGKSFDFAGGLVYPGWTYQDSVNFLRHMIGPGVLWVVRNNRPARHMEVRVSP